MLREREKKREEGGVSCELEARNGSWKNGQMDEGVMGPAPRSDWRPFRVNKLSRAQSLASKDPQLLVLLLRVTR